MIKKRQWEHVNVLLGQELSVGEVAKITDISLPTIYKFIKKGRKIDRFKTKTNSDSSVEKYITSNIKNGKENQTKLFEQIKRLGYYRSYSTFNRYINNKKKEQLVKNYKPALHLESFPGLEVQVDWGSFGKIEINGKKENLSSC